MMQVNRWDAYYLLGLTPWELSGPHPVLVRLVQDGSIQPCRAVDLGCGTGHNVVFLASHGFDVVGVDVSSRAVGLARRRVARAGVSADIRQFDLMRDSIAPDDPGFDLTVDIGTMHTFDPGAHSAFAAAVARLGRAGSSHLAFGMYPGQWQHRGKGRLVRVPPGITCDGLISSFSPHGYRLVAEKAIFPGPDGKPRAGWHLFMRE